MADENMPDFDKMSPEELMAWMESLAKRQGATEGFTTDADMEIAEVDPDTVVLDEPGYVPSEGKSKGQVVLPPATAKPKPAVPPSVQQPAASIEPPVLEPLELSAEEADTEMAQAVAPQSAMAWLESLTVDQSGLPELDLSGLGAEIEPIAEAPTDPIAWLEGLAEGQGEAAPVAASSEVSDPFAGGVDPMNWLESLAKRQGVKDEELLTEADLSIPAPASLTDSGPGYTDYSVDAPVAETAETPPASLKVSKPAVMDPSQLESPADWLDSLASGQGFTTKTAEPVDESEDILSDDDMKEALRSGKEIAPEEMEAWFSRQLDRGFEREEPELLEEDEEALAEYDPEAPAIPAALPDWLSEMAPAPPEPPQVPVVEQQAFVDKIVEPPAVPDMPDWLKEEVGAHSDLDLDSIFASTEVAEPAAPATAVTQTASPLDLQVDHSDPWVEAFDHEQGIITLPDVPPPAASAALEEAVLETEEELPAGQPESMPSWLGEAAPTAEPVAEADMPDWLSEAAPAAEPLAAADMPDWLKEVSAEIEPHEIPDWLKETADTEEQVVIPQPPPAPVATTPVTMPPVTPPPVVPAAISPAPVPPQAVQIDVAATLTSARSLSQSSVDASLLEYEKLVRANVELDAVVDDLSLLLSKNDKNPAVYRVLGDGLMRKGQLQAALDIYRKALNLL